jgi:mRNA interferase YafQ
MLTPVTVPGFDREVKAARKKHRDMGKLKQAMALIIENSEESKQLLVSRFKDHSLSGNHQGRRECHLDRADWLLLYTLDEESNMVAFIATGSHDQLFSARGR